MSTRDPERPTQAPPNHRALGTPQAREIGVLGEVDDWQLYEALQEFTCKQVARFLGINIRTLYRRRQRPSYKKLLTEVAREVQTRVLDRRESDMRMALETVAEICKNGLDDHARLQAARLLLTVHDSGALSENDPMVDDRSEMIKKIVAATEQNAKATEAVH